MSVIVCAHKDIECLDPACRSGRCKLDQSPDSEELAKRLEEYAAKLAADKSSETAWWKHPLANDIREAAALLRAREPAVPEAVRETVEEWATRMAPALIGNGTDYPALLRAREPVWWWCESDEPGLSASERVWFAATAEEAEDYAREGYTVTPLYASPLPAEPARPELLEEIAAERRRQIEHEGWDAEHDDAHEFGTLARAAAWYSLNLPVHRWNDWCGPASPHSEASDLFRSENYGWPWDIKWWKPKDARRDLIRAAALIVAEIERLDRRALKGETK